MLEIASTTNISVAMIATIAGVKSEDCSNIARHHARGHLPSHDSFKLECCNNQLNLVKTEAIENHPCEAKGMH